MMYSTVVSAQRSALHLFKLEINLGDGEAIVAAAETILLPDCSFIYPF